MDAIFSSAGELDHCLGFDTETAKFAQGNMTPRMVCATFWGFGAPPDYLQELADAVGPTQALLRSFTPSDSLDTWEALFDRTSGLQALLLAFQDKTRTKVAANPAYDAAVKAVAAEQMLGSTEATEVLALILDEYDAGRVTCVELRDMLLANSYGLIRAGKDESGPPRHAEGGFWSLMDIVLRRLVDKDSPEGRALLEDKKGVRCLACQGKKKVSHVVPGGGGKMEKVPCPRCLGVGSTESWRLRFSELDGVPVDQWPSKPVDYAIEDAKWALLVALHQAGDFGRTSGTEEGTVVFEDGSVLDADRQTRAQLSLHLMSIHGMRTDRERVELWRGEVEGRAQEGQDIGERLGFVRVKGRDKGKPGSVNQKMLGELVDAAYARLDPPRQAPRTPTGKVSLSGDTLKESRDPDLMAWAAVQPARKAISTHLPILELGTDHAMTSKPGTFVRSGRCSWSKPALHQPPRKGRFRECFQARPGMLFVACDWTSAETFALAQMLLWMFGWSKMAEALLEGKDLHVDMAAMLLDISYGEAMRRRGLPLESVERMGCRYHPSVVAYSPQELAECPCPTCEVKARRQLSKALNFGFPGGLGAKTFVIYARDTWGVRITEQQAREYKRKYLEKWPEMVLYFRFFSDASGGGFFTYPQWVSGRQRGDCGYTDGCNTGFQGLVADAAKSAAWLVTLASYHPRGGIGELPMRQEDCARVLDIPAGGALPEDILPRTGERSPLYGFRPTLLLHDELMGEAPHHLANDMARELERIMVMCLQCFCPALATAIRADPALMYRWRKASDTKTDGNGKLIPWDNPED